MTDGLQETIEQLETLKAQQEIIERDALVDTINREGQGRITAEVSPFTSRVVYVKSGDDVLQVICTMKQWEVLKAFAQAWNTPTEQELQEMEYQSQESPESRRNGYGAEEVNDLPGHIPSLISLDLTGVSNVMANRFQKALANRFEKAFPIGSRVRAFEPMGEWQDGHITAHTEDRNEGNGLIVTFEDGHWSEFPYSYIDIDNRDNSYVVSVEENREYQVTLGQYRFLVMQNPQDKTVVMFVEELPSEDGLSFKAAIVLWPNTIDA